MTPAGPAEVAEWIRAYTPRLLAVARAFAAGADEAEDILQQVWITAYRKAHLRPPGTPIGAWLHRVTMNEGRSRLKRVRRRLRLQALWRTDLGEESDRTPAPDAAAELARARLWRAIAALPSLQRDVLLMRIVDDASTRDVARALGRAEGTVKASLHRALAKLRAELREGDAGAAGLTTTLAEDS